MFSISKLNKSNLSDIEGIKKVEETSTFDTLKEKDIDYEIYENPVSNFLILKNSLNKVVGYIDYWITFDSSTIFKIVILDSYRNKGLGTYLLSETIKILKEYEDKDDHTKLLFLTLEVRKSNLSAISLYHKVGFKEITIKPSYYEDGEDAIYMVKDLNE